MGPDDEHAAYVTHLSAGFDLRPHHESRGVDQAQERDPVNVAQLHEAGRIVGIFRFDGAGHILIVVGDDAERFAFDADESIDDAHAIVRAKLQE